MAEIPAGYTYGPFQVGLVVMPDAIQEPGVYTGTPTISVMLGERAIYIPVAEGAKVRDYLTAVLAALEVTDGD